MDIQLKMLLPLKQKVSVTKILVTVLAIGFCSTAVLLLRHETAHSPIKTADEVVSGRNGVPEKIFVPDNKSSVSVTSQPFRSQFAFNAIAPHWKEKPGTGNYESFRSMKIRVSDDNKKWGEWLDVSVSGPLRDSDPRPDEMFPEAPLFIPGRYFQFNVTIERPAPDVKTPEMSEVVITYLDSRETTSTKISKNILGFVSPSAVAAEQGPGVVTRAGWGSPDPDNTLFKSTDKEWPATYAPVTQVFIHHTVDSNYSSDFSAVVRGIWQYHSYTRGWGDIGYNYLVDGNGRVYEGRFGGDNVVGGHVLGFNAGSMGVGLLGCFQPNNYTCASLNGGNVGPSSSMLNSLYDLVGWKAKNYEIDPRTTHTFCGNVDANYECRNLFTVSGHRDGNDTTCPGDYVYNLLPTIREAAESRKANLFPYAAKQLTYGPITSSSGQTIITLQFKNTGSTTWSNSSPRFFLKTANPDDRTSSIQGDGWITSQHAALLSEENVPPGSVGTFTFKVNTDDKPVTTFYEGFRLVAEGVTDLKSYFMIPIITPTYNWSLVSLSHSSGTALMAPDDTQTITVIASNTGTATWSKNGSYPMRLGTLPDSRASPFYTNGWLSPSRIASLQEDTVAPGGNGTFVFQVQAPSKEGEYGERFSLVAENRTWANDTGAEVYFRVDNPFKWEVVSLSHSSGTALMDPGEAQTITVRAKNIGLETWSNSGSSPVKLGTWEPTRASPVAYPTWPSAIRAAVLQEATVAPDETGTFTFTVRAPYGGEFFERMNLVTEGITWFNDPGLFFYLNVRHNFTWEFVSLNHSTGTAINSAGSTLTLTLKAKNTGNTTWKNSGDFPVRLGTTRPQNRGSVLHHSSWMRDFRPVTLQEDSIPPGSIGTFVFQAKAPSTPGEYYEHFSLVAENLKWLNDPGVYFYIKSVP